MQADSACAHHGAFGVAVSGGDDDNDDDEIDEGLLIVVLVLGVVIILSVLLVIGLLARKWGQSITHYIP